MCPIVPDGLVMESGEWETKRQGLGNEISAGKLSRRTIRRSPMIEYDAYWQVS
ncbi:MAG: hypothetical protein HQ516_08165 [Chlorobium sp.]|nr:hypothetical protein [Chlorobium phaeovibrioides]NQU47004.1 hypothetical protein [Chlorobium sp.]